jgi:hypothetical protein
MIFGWSGGLAVPESFFWLYPGLTSGLLSVAPPGLEFGRFVLGRLPN